MHAELIFGGTVSAIGIPVDCWYGSVPGTSCFTGNSPTGTCTTGNTPKVPGCSAGHAPEVPD